MLLELVRKGLPRGKAYEIVQRNAIRAWEEKKEFMDLLLQDEELRSYMTEEEIKGCFDMSRSLRHAGKIIERAKALWDNTVEGKYEIV